MYSDNVLCRLKWKPDGSFIAEMYEPKNDSWTDGTAEGGETSGAIAWATFGGCKVPAKEVPAIIAKLKASAEKTDRMKHRR